MKNLSRLQKVILGMQHTLAMFGATILVPMLTGLDISVTLFSAGVGTLLFHFLTKRKVPVFLGSSFAYIPVIQHVVNSKGQEYAMGGIVTAGILYLLFSLLIYVAGVERVSKLFPPIVTGPIIAIIGLTLAPVAVGMASENWIIALSVLITILLVSLFAKGFAKFLPILLGITVGYIVSMALGVVDFSVFQETSLITVPSFTFPKFDIGSILIIAPVSLVTILEHIADINANSKVVGKNFLKDPGLHRTVLGDGVATIFAGLVGAPPNTTYSENTGVLATTKVYEPSILRIAAMFAILLSFTGFLGAFLQTIPVAVIGGASLILFGMIASIGFKTIAQSEIDLNDNKNTLIMSIILVVGLGGEGFNIFGIDFSALSIAAITGIILNLLLSRVKKEN